MATTAQDRPSAAAPGSAAQARAMWLARTPRERLGATLAAAALLLLLVWVAAVRPALRTMREAPAQIDRLDAELRRMQTLAAESRLLRAEPPIPPSQAGAALQAATARLGAAGRLALQGDRATLTLDGVQPPALAAWLDEARSTARARPLEAQLTRSPKGGYSGTLAVGLGSGR